MKTKEDFRKSLLRRLIGRTCTGAAYVNRRLQAHAWGAFQLLDSQLPTFNFLPEQSQNVDENKGQVQNVAALLNVKSSRGIGLSLRDVEPERFFHKR